MIPDRAIGFAAVLAGLFVTLSVAAAQDSRLKDAVELSQKQNTVRFDPNQAIQIVTTEQSGRKPEVDRHLAAFSDQGGIYATCDSRNLLLIYLANPEYGGLIEGKPKNKFTGKSFSEMMPGKYFQNTFYAGNADNLDWFHGMVRMISCGRYNNIGNMEFPAAYEQWLLGDAIVETRLIETPKPLQEYNFAGWPIGDGGRMTYRFDPITNAIVQIEATIGGIKAKLEVLQFAELGSVPFPKKVMQVVDAPGADTLTKVTEWEYVDLASTSFREEMTYFPYYDVRVPDLDALPEKNGIAWYYYLLMMIAAIGIAVGLYFKLRS